MPDPREGVDDDGYLVTGASAANLRPPFTVAIEDAARRCAERCRGSYGLYLYGSVATGQAREGVSDLDLLLVLESAGDRDAVEDLAAELTERHRDVVREVSLPTALVDEVFADDPQGLGTRCFLKHYCVHVAGDDLSRELPRCRPSAALAVGFAGDTRQVLDRLAAAVAQTADAAELGRLARSAARKLLLTCAAVVSLRLDGTWTTDRQLAVTELARRHPDRRDELQRALRWSRPDRDIEVDAATLRRFLGSFGTWVLEQFELALEAHGKR